VAKILADKAADLRGGKTLEERIVEEIKAKLKDKPALKVHVAIKEEILRAPVPDPAAQTEIARTFEAAGWKVVEREGEADLTIKGEAFGEAGSRRGNLWFTRARLEFSLRVAGG
jgi:hypothetical protein